MITTDFLVIGSGIAGLTYALKVSQALPNHTITLVTKAEQTEANTQYAQGGIAVVLDSKKDTFEKHIKDTLIAGDGLCNEKVVEFVVKEAPERFQEVVNWGASFDRIKSGKFDLGKEGGHSEHRIAHHKDITGKEMLRALLENAQRQENINILDHHFVVDLITEHHVKRGSENQHCFGAYVLNTATNAVEKVLSKVTMLASGGTGQVYKSTTNPLVATGDGVALAYRANAKISNMEFIQFHPTSLYGLDESPSFLISEAVRGEGAYLVNKQGQRFMKKYDDREELASRDIVARAIDSEMKKYGKPCMYLDCRHLDMKVFKKHFPNITEKCMSVGIDVSKDLIPVVPACHYLCGGIDVNEYGQTTIKRLYASGECTNTGLHGANRLASNSLLEALVFAHRAYEETIQIVDQYDYNLSIPEWNSSGTVEPNELVVVSHTRKSLQNLMSDYVAIVRSNERLELASEQLAYLYKQTKKNYDKNTLSLALCEVRNLVTVAYLIIEQSKKRTENRGGFFNVDLEN